MKKLQLEKYLAQEGVTKQLCAMQVGVSAALISKCVWETKHEQRDYWVTRGEDGKATQLMEKRSPWRVLGVQQFKS